MRRANTTFVNLRATLDDAHAARRRVQAGRARSCARFFAELRPLARDARPTLRDLSQTIHAPGEDNDLIELTRAAEPLRDIAVSTAPRDGAVREGAFPATDEGARAGDARARVPPALRARPHRLVRRLQPLRASTTRSAGRAARRLHVNAFANVNGVLSRCSTATTASKALGQGLSLGQRERCPGAIERGRSASRRPTSRATRPRGRSANEARARSSSPSSAPERVRDPHGARADDAKPNAYWVELDNAFGLIHGGDLKIAGVRAGQDHRASSSTSTRTTRWSASDRQDAASARCAATCTASRARSR